MIYKSVYSALFLLAFSLVSVLPTSHSHAGNVTLQLADGNLLIEGELLSFDGKKYTIQSNELGKATFEAHRFICIDGKCPKKNSNPFAFHDSTTDFNIYGSNAIGTRLMPWVIRGYSRDKGLYGRETISKNGKEVRFSLTNEYDETVTNINLYRYGSNTAFPALHKRKAVLGMSNRSIEKSEIDQLKGASFSNFQNRHEHVIGVDGVVVIVSHDNPVTNLTLDEVARIFSGKITDWSEVGGKPGKINIYMPDQKSGTASTFSSTVMKPRTLTVSNSAKPVDSIEQLSERVAKDADGIGITSFAYIDKSKALNFKTSCGLIHKPTQFNIKTGAYPLSRKLYLYTASIIENRHAVGLLNFAKNSKDMDSILNIAGFVTRKVSQSSFNDQKERVFSSMAGADENFDTDMMRRILAEIGKGTRLSYTARFRPNTADLTPGSRNNFPKLINHLTTEVTPENYIVVAGFSDTDGNFRENTVLSLKRAQAVRKLLMHALKDKIKGTHIIARGYGEMMPSACNTTIAGKKKNRRVEIWVVDAATGKKMEQEQKIPLSDEGQQISHLENPGF